MLFCGAATYLGKNSSVSSPEQMSAGVESMYGLRVGGVSEGIGVVRAPSEGRRDGRSPVSASAAVLRRHKVTLCPPLHTQIASAGEQSVIHHFNWPMHTKAFIVG